LFAARMDQLSNKHQIREININTREISPRYSQNYNTFYLSLDTDSRKLRETNEENFKNLEIFRKSSENKISLTFIWGNKIMKDMFIGFTNLTILNINKTYLRIIENNTFNGLKNLIKLDLSKNNIENINQNTFEGLANLKILNLSGNDIKFKDKTPFVLIPTLKELFLSDSRILFINENIFDGIDQLEILDLSQNALENATQEKLFSSLRYLKNLKNLNLNSTGLNINLRDCPFQSLKELEYLNLGNKVTLNNNTFDSNIFGGILNLKELDISYIPNNFAENTFNNLPKLEKIHNLINMENFFFFTDSIKYDLKPFLLNDNLKYLYLFDGFEFETQYFNKIDINIKLSNLNDSAKFYGKNLVNNEKGTLYTVHPNYFESIELKDKGFNRLQKGFKWKNEKLNKLTAIIGLNGIGKTSFLQLIDKSLMKNHSFFISKYFSSAVHKLSIDQENYQILNDQLCENAFTFKTKQEFTSHVYDSINDFSLLQYFDYLLLIGFKYDDFKIIQFEYDFSEIYIEHRISEQKMFLYRYQDDTKEPTSTYYSKNASNEIRSIEYYLNVNKNHKLSPGEYLILLIHAS